MLSLCTIVNGQNGSIETVNNAVGNVLQAGGDGVPRAFTALVVV